MRSRFVFLAPASMVLIAGITVFMEPGRGIGGTVPYTVRSAHVGAVRSMGDSDARPGHRIRNSPSKRFASFFGGSDMDVGTAVAIAPDGSVFMAGNTLSDDFPTLNPVHPYRGGTIIGSDAFISAFSSSGDVLLWSTYLGGGMGQDVATSIAVDNDGRVWVAGSTNSPDFPLRGSLQNYRGGDELLTDAFVARLADDGTSLDFASFFGGSGDETVTGMAVGPDGSVYLTGTTTSMDFPVTDGVVQSVRAGNPEIPRADAWIARLVPNGDAVLTGFATYLGGSWDDIPRSLDVDADGNVWLTGLTTSDDFPLSNPVQSEFAGPYRDFDGDAFLARMNSDGSSLDFSTYLGGARDDHATGVAIGDGDHVYVSGSTMSPDFPTTPGAYEPDRLGFRDRFVSRFARAGMFWTLDASTRFGVSGGFESGSAPLQVDRAGRVWIAGATASEQLPIREADQPFHGGGYRDGYIARIDDAAGTLGYSTFLGGAESETVTAIALGDDLVCVTGGTASPDFPVKAAYQSQFDGPATGGRSMTSAFLACYDVVNVEATLSAMSVNPDTARLAPGETLQFSAAGYDQFDQFFPVSAVWSATGGVIDSTGHYSAGEDPGTFFVTATDTASGLSANAVVNIMSGVSIDADSLLPRAFALHGNYPNPFNPSTLIRFDVRANAGVRLTVYDALGRRRQTVLDRAFAPGRHEIRLDASDWPSGVYFYEIEMTAHEGRVESSYRAVRQMVLVR